MSGTGKKNVYCDDKGVGMKKDKILEDLRVDKKNKIKLTKCKTDSVAGVKDKKEAREELLKVTAELDELQYKLAADGKTAVLIVFQAMDTAGKDGVIRKVIGPLNPQGVEVSSFKRPTSLEFAHDYLWRIHRRTPARGMIGVFNRSHYEDVLVHRVHNLEPEKVLNQRYEQLNEFERHLHENGTRIVKFFLHISKDEQKRRLQARLDNPKKRWKFTESDVAERKLWDKYQEAYQYVLDRCATDYAPWYVVPADNKWYRDWVVSNVLLNLLKDINPKFPQEMEGLDKIKID